MDLLILLLLSLSGVVKSDLSDPKVWSCSNDYKRFSVEHSGCKQPNPTCEIKWSTISKEEELLILDLHNSYRSVIASAQRTESGLPSAANMMQLEWDNELAAVAANYAKQCAFAHDCNNCRRVMNFAVGQNIAMQSVTGINVPIPLPDWTFAVTEWFEEIVYFTKDLIKPFQAPTGGEYRHFTQLVWADTFRIGCGYVLYVKGSTWTKLYVCNYGPAGNTYKTALYQEGAVCSQCPINTCCGLSCKEAPKYPGLCKRTNNEPLKKPSSNKKTVIFKCDFSEPHSDDCLTQREGDGSYKIVPALGGYYAETVLSPGQTSTLTFTKPITPISKQFCVVIHYRKGPIQAGNPDIGEVREIFVIPDMNYFSFPQLLETFPEANRMLFNHFSLSLNWDSQTHMKIKFSVPANGTEQFLNIESITAVDGHCL